MSATATAGCRWITTGEAAELLQVTPRTIRRWVRDRWLTGRWIGPGRRLQVSEHEIRELADAHLSLAFDVQTEPQR